VEAVMTTRSANRPRGRAVLLWSAGLFAGLQLTAGVLLDYRWPQVRFPRFFEQVGRFETLAKTPSILLLGSSRTGCVFNEAEATRAVRELTGDPEAECFNAAIPAGDLIVCERLLGRLLDRGARPRCVVIEVCPEGLNHHPGWLSMYVGWILCWNDVPGYLKDLAATGNLVRFAGTRFVPLYVYRDQIRRQLAAEICRLSQDPPAGPEATPAPAPAGLSPGEAIAKWRKLIADDARDAPTDPNYRTAVGLDDVLRTVRDYRPGGNATAALERMLVMCRSHGIEPILLSVPLSSGHRRCYTPDVEAPFRAYLADVTRRYGCRYYDFREALPDALFRDHHHARPAGGLLFTRRFGLDVLAPAWVAATHGR
jgi:hypothetical protein